MGILDLMKEISFLFPAMYALCYAFYMKLSNRFFFVASVLGVQTLLALLLLPACVPLYLFYIKVLPQLALNQSIENIVFLLEILDFLEKYFFDFIFPWVAIALARLVHKRYDIFEVSEVGVSQV